jgi:hypothetical protein
VNESNYLPTKMEKKITGKLIEDQSLPGCKFRNSKKTISGGFVHDLSACFDKAAFYVGKGVNPC